MTARIRRPLAVAIALAMSVVGMVGGAAATGDRGASSGSLLQLRLAADEPAEGRADAPLTLLEFTDYQCPFCRRFQAETWPRLKRLYVDTGKVRFIVRDLPLEIHSGAEPAAQAAHCAAEQGRFWPMHDALLASDADLSAAGIERIARAQGLDPTRFKACVSAGNYRSTILRNAAQAHDLGLDGTPAFVLGTVSQGELRGHALMGARPFEDFEAAIRQALAARQPAA
jgi:protein-disulfide isomerase